MASLRYTHGFDILYKVVVLGGIVLLGSVGLTVAAISVVAPSLDYVPTYLLPDAVLYTFLGIAVLAIWLGCLRLLCSAVLLPTQPLPTFLYLRLWLRVPASWQDAKETSFLFDGSLGGWHSLTSLWKVPRHLRRDILREFAASIARHSSAIPNPHSDPPRPALPPPLSTREQRLITAREILRVSGTAGVEEVKSAYRTMMKKYHPDIYAASRPELRGFAEEKAKQLNQAYALLMEELGSV